MRRNRKPAARAYKNSVWYRETRGDRYVGACPVCNEGKDRFKVVFQGEYQDHFFCERCAPPGSRQSGWAQQVLDKLGLWEHRPRHRKTAPKEISPKSHGDRISANRKHYEEVRAQRQSAESLRETADDIRKVLGDELSKRLIGWAQVEDHPGLHYSGHQLERVTPVTAPEHAHPSLAGDWVSWAELYRHTPLFRGWLELSAMYPAGFIAPEHLKVLQSLSVKSLNYPGDERPTDDLPDVWAVGTCPKCRQGNLFIGVLTDQVWTTGCPIDSGNCVHTEEDTVEMATAIETVAMETYNEKRKEYHG